MNLTEETARALIEAMNELTFVVKGLTGVLIDDQAEPAEPDPDPAPAPPRTYMDGSEVGG